MSNKQKMAVALIVAITTLLAGLIVLFDAPPAGKEIHAEAGHGHDESKEHGKEEHDDKKAPAHGNDHQDNEPHQENDKKTDAHGAGRNSGEPHHDEKIALSEAQLNAAGIAVATSGPARIQNRLRLPGEIRFNQDRTAHVTPKVAGVVEAVPADLGQRVKKGQVLAVITSSTISEQRGELLTAQRRLELARITFAREKKLWEEKISAEQDFLQAQQALREAEIAVQNARQKLAALGPAASPNGALNRFEIRAPFDGMVMEKHITLGESVKEDANIFTISDLSTVWAEIVIPAKEINQVRVGEMATVTATAFASSATGKVSYVGSLLGEQTRSAKGRIVLPNPQGAWRPGLFVNVDIATNDADVPVAVATDAVQTVNDRTVVFQRVEGGFIAQPVTTGRSDGKQIEIVQGLQPDVPYAANGSFVLKSEQGKASAQHTH
jgi:cobalt-zinc-cadmium efflux system membrane fusion protein